ncbi:MAG: single-stranded-DNA-specific exonuclease RecJ [Patescibacteria group bacterium]|jgi:single-stranded-DNA-specific exonuclease
MLEKKWEVKPGLAESDFNHFPEINPIVLQLLFNRGLNVQQNIDDFLNPEYEKNLSDPFLFTEMEKAVNQILTAIENKEKIVVYGDYDADGVCSSALLVELLRGLGGKPDVYIPYRETEGYGLNIEAVTELAAKGTKLLITVDCGVSNKTEIDLLNQKGVEVIVTDHHHQPKILPEAFAIINPNVEKETYPFRGLCGCGVAFKLAQAITKKQKDFKVNQLETGFEKWLLDLVAIATIADMQPLLAENRILVKYGLIVLQKTKRLGLLKLIEKMSNNLTVIDERVVGWQISPRLNAAGRLNHASSAYQLLITDQVEEAQKLALELNQTNTQRQQLTEKITAAAKEILGSVKDQKFLAIVGTDWPTGIVGLVSGRITDEFNRPSLVISRYNGEIIGSGRSIPEFNIIEAIQKCDQYLTRYGGHGQAAGFTLKDEPSLELFIQAMTKLAEAELTGKDLKPILEIDAEIKLEQVNWELFEELAKFPPYGEGNPKPRFLAQNLTVAEMQTLGQDGKHLRLMVKHTTPIIRKTIGFCFGDWCAKLKVGDKVDMIFEVDVNEWNGNRELQLKIVDLRINKK